VNLAQAPAVSILLAGRPVSLEVPVGINESALTTPVVRDDDDLELEDEEPGGSGPDGDESDDGDTDD
jgi:hypothetical protein